jgi:hypothetical protein
MISRLAAVALVAVAASGCNAERKQQCDALLTAMKPLDQGTPTADLVDTVRKRVAGLTVDDQPLHIYATNYGQTLTVLANTLRLQEGTNAPDGTAAVVKQNLEKARTDRADVQRYCAQ